MSVTYSEPNTIDPAVREEDFVPSYARGSRKKKSVKTWMILAPIGALALLGGGAALMMSGGTATAPLEEAAALSTPLAAPVVAPLESSTLPSNAVIESPVITPSAPSPVVREAAPAPPPAVRARRAQPAPTAVESAPVVRQETAPTPAGPVAYAPAPSTATSSATATPPAPSIAVAPLN